MGAYLDKPKEEKLSENGSNSFCKWGASSMQGWRINMEDAHVCQEVRLPTGETGTIFGVFDGHGGDQVALFAAQNIKKILEEELKKSNIAQALEATFMRLDKDVSSEKYAEDTGTTSCVVLITPTEIYCANAGDSRAVLCSDG